MPYKREIVSAVGIPRIYMLSPELKTPCQEKAAESLCPTRNVASFRQSKTTISKSDGINRLE
jgi:hypothetical protein